MTEADASETVSRRGFLRAAAGAAAVAGASGTAAAQEEGGGGTATVQVGPGGDFVYTPGTDEPLVIAPGTTVEFVWESDNHNVVVDSQPEGANWEGHEALENTGFSFSSTFDTIGTYEYHCDPHLSLGMTGTIEVQEGGAQEEASGPVEPPIPNSAKTLGIATLGAMLSTLGLAYFFMKYGGDYEMPE